METNPRDKDRRKELRRREFGTDPACICCGETDPVAFHHLAGWINDPGLEGPFCLNCHAKAHEALRDAGVDISHDRYRSFPERLEAVIRSLAACFALLAERLLRWADRQREFVRQLDLHVPAWRDIKGCER